MILKYSYFDLDFTGVCSYDSTSLHVSIGSCIDLIVAGQAPSHTLNQSWWRHQMEIFSALLAICAGNSPVTGEFPAQRPVTGSLMFSLICTGNKRSSKQSRGWWFETPSCPLWRHCNDDPVPWRTQMPHQASLNGFNTSSFIKKIRLLLLVESCKPIRYLQYPWQRETCLFFIYFL